MEFRRCDITRIPSIQDAAFLCRLKIVKSLFLKNLTFYFNSNVLTSLMISVSNYWVLQHEVKIDTKFSVVPFNKMDFLKQKLILLNE